MATISSSNPFAEGVERFCSRLVLSDEKFEEMSAQAARDLRQNKAAYFRRVLMMAAMGYGYITFIVGSMVAFVAAIAIAMWNGHFFNIGLVKILLVFGIFVFGMVRALWIKTPPPVGIKLERDEAPALFQLIDKFKSELNTSVDVVMINDDFNAFVTQIPKLGFLGLHTNYLVLGLPLMAALNANQFSAVLAHELGHLSGNHSKRAAWVYGLRARWSQLLITMRHESPVAFAVFYVFFSWLAPRFNAYTMALARSHELDADKDAQRIAGEANMASSLVLVRLKGRYLDEVVWADVVREAIDRSKPTERVFDGITESLRGLPIENSKAEDWLKRALKEKGSGMDTHPSLCERLDAGSCLHDYEHSSPELIEQLKSPIPPGETAAEVFLGKALPTCIDKLSSQWTENIAGFWTDKHEFFKSAKGRLLELDAKAEAEELTVEDWKEKAYYVGEMQGFDACRPIFEEILSRFPNDPAANYAVGSLMVDDGNEEGIVLLEKAMAMRMSLVSDCVSKISNFLEERGRKAEADKYESKLSAFKKESERAEKERNGVTVYDELLPHELAESWIDFMNEVFPLLPAIEAAYVVRKEVHYFTDYPYLVLALDVKGSAEDKLALARWLIGNLNLPHAFCVITFDGDAKKLKQRVLAVDNSQVYDKKFPRIKEKETVQTPAP